jgi:hypothetical protein
VGLGAVQEVESYSLVRKEKDGQNMSSSLGDFHPNEYTLGWDGNHYTLLKRGGFDYNAPDAMPWSVLAVFQPRDKDDIMKVIRKLQQP